MSKHTAEVQSAASDAVDFITTHLHSADSGYDVYDQTLAVLGDLALGKYRIIKKRSANAPNKGEPS